MISSPNRAMNAPENITGFIASLRSCKTSYDVFGVMKGICKKYGYNSFIVLQLPNQMDLSLNDKIIVTNWHPELIRAYDFLELMAESPIIDHLRRSSLPLAFDIEQIYTENGGRRTNEVVELFKQYGQTNGFSLVCPGRHNDRGTVTYGGSGTRINDHQLAELGFLSLHIYDRLIEITKTDPVDECILTGREKDCLVWTAAGKTSSETAQILGISENTVNHYLSAAAAKLGATNKAHAVVKAIKQGILDI